MVFIKNRFQDVSISRSPFIQKRCPQLAVVNNRAGGNASLIVKEIAKKILETALV